MEEILVLPLKTQGGFKKFSEAEAGLEIFQQLFNTGFYIQFTNLSRRISHELMCLKFEIFEIIKN